MGDFKLVKLIDPIQMYIDGTFNPMGAYDNGTDYAVGDMVSYNGSSYIMYNNGPAGTLPTDTSYWGLVAAKGNAGANGSDGDAATIAVGTVDTVSPGDPATVTNSGTSSAAVFDFEIPQGDPGANGADGVVQTLVAGTGIDVDDTDPANPIISNTLTSAVWGDITGTLSDQTDLQTELDTKFELPSLSAGSVLFSNGTTIAQDNANLFYDDSNNRLGFLTTAPTHTETHASTSTGLAFHNQTDQVTNYERALMSWGSNVFALDLSKGGSGSDRTLRLSAGSSTSNWALNLVPGSNSTLRGNDGLVLRTFQYVLTLGSSSSSNPGLSFSGNNSSGSSLALVSISNTNTSSGGDSVGLSVGQTYNQTSTAGSATLRVNRVDTALGSGSHYIMQLRNNSNDRVVVDTNGLTGWLTSAPTHTLTLGSTATGIALYNTSDQTTNYERVREYWNSNVFTLLSEAGGSGTVRDIRLTSNTSTATVSNSATGFFTLDRNTSSSGTHTRLTGTQTQSSSSLVMLSVAPTINQSGTAGYTALLINPTESATGSGTKRLIDAQVGSSSKFVVGNDGKTIVNGSSMPAQSSATFGVNNNRTFAAAGTHYASDMRSLPTFNTTGAGSWMGADLTSIVTADANMTEIQGVAFQAGPSGSSSTTVTTVIGMVGFATSAGTPAVTTAISGKFQVGGLAGAVTDSKGVQVVSGQFVGSSTNVVGVEIGALPGSTSKIGVDVAAQSGATTNIGIRNAAPYVATPSSAQNITAVGNTILANAQVVQLTANASYTLTSAPTIANGSDGQIVTIVNVDSTDVITIQDQGTLGSSNLRLSATTIALGPNDSITLMYSSTVGDWIQIGQVNVL